MSNAENALDYILIALVRLHVCTNRMRVCLNPRLPASASKTRFLLAQLNKQTSVQNELRARLAALKEHVLSTTTVAGGDDSASQSQQPNGSAQLLNGSGPDTDTLTSPANSKPDLAHAEQPYKLNCELLVSFFCVVL